MHIHMQVCVTYVRTYVCGRVCIGREAPAFKWDLKWTHSRNGLRRSRFNHERPWELQFGSTVLTSTAPRRTPSPPCSIVNKDSRTSHTIRTCIQTINEKTKKYRQKKRIKFEVYEMNAKDVLLFLLSIINWFSTNVNFYKLSYYYDFYIATFISMKIYLSNKSI